MNPVRETPAVGHLSRTGKAQHCRREARAECWAWPSQASQKPSQAGPTESGSTWAGPSQERRERSWGLHNRSVLAVLAVQTAGLCTERPKLRLEVFALYWRAVRRPVGLSVKTAGLLRSMESGSAQGGPVS